MNWREQSDRYTARRLAEELAEYETSLAEHDERLARRDRLAELADLPNYGVHVEQAHDRERRRQFDERKARNLLRPRTGNVEVQPASVCTCNARETGVPHDGHRYSCPRYTRHPASAAEDAAA